MLEARDTKDTPHNVKRIGAEHQESNWYFGSDPLGRETDSEMREGRHGNLESFSSDSTTIPAVWSHSLLMASIWSGLAGLVAARIGRRTRTGVVFGLVVFSHWVVDFITHPMTAVFPSDIGLPLWFHGSPLVGLGLYRHMSGVYVGEFGTLALGIVVYVFARRKPKGIRTRAA